MVQVKQVKDLMVDIFDFPHMPHWFTIRQAIGIIKASAADTKKYPGPLTILVFDEKYCLLGTMGLRDILKGIEPRFQQAAAKVQVPEHDESGLKMLWDGLFSQESKVMAERPVREVMNPIKFSVGPGDPATKAAYLMIHNDLALLPVLEDSKKFVGLVRMVELFDAMSNTVMES